MARCPSTVERFSRHLECAVCLDIYDKPKALPCQHTFCLMCIRRTAKGSTVQCPSCKVFHRIPNDNPEEFPNNYTLLPMIDEFKQLTLQEDVQEEGEDVARVMSSASEVVTVIRTQNRQSLANLAVDSLKEIENRAESFDLIVNRLQTLQGTLATTSTEIKSSISADIRQVVKCLQEREQELHDEIALHAYTENSRLQILKGEVAAHARHLRQICNEKTREINSSEDQWKDILDQGDRSLQQIARVCKQFEEIEYQAIEFSVDATKRDATIQELKSYGQLSVLSKTQPILRQRSRFQSLPLMTSSSTEHSPSISKHRSSTMPKRRYGSPSGSPALRRSRHSSEDKRVRSVSSCDSREEMALRSPVALRSPDAIHSLRSLPCYNRRPESPSPLREEEQDLQPTEFEEHVIELLSRENTTTLTGQKDDFDFYLRNLRDSRCRFVCQPEKIIEGSEYDPLYPLGMSVLSEDKLAVASGSCLRIFNSFGVELTPRAPLRNRKARVLADVCCQPNGTIIATDSFNNEVLHYNSAGRPRGIFTMEVVGRKLDKPIKPYGVTCDKQGFLYICDRENKCVLICRPNGVVGKVIGRDRLKDPLYVALNKTETVMYVSDCQAAAVFVFTTDGDFVRRLPKTDQKSPELRSRHSSVDENCPTVRFARPSGLTLTPDSNLVVCDSEQNLVQVLNPNTGTVLGIIGGKESGTEERAGASANQPVLERPMGVVFIDDLKAISVCDTNNNRVQMYKWE